MGIATTSRWSSDTDNRLKWNLDPVETLARMLDERFRKMRLAIQKRIASLFWCEKKFLTRESAKQAYKKLPDFEQRVWLFEEIREYIKNPYQVTGNESYRTFFEEDFFVPNTLPNLQEFSKKMEQSEGVTLHGTLLDIEEFIERDLEKILYKKIILAFKNLSNQEKEWMVNVVAKIDMIVHSHYCSIGNFMDKIKKEQKREEKEGVGLKNDRAKMIEDLKMLKFNKEVTGGMERTNTEREKGNKKRNENQEFVDLVKNELFPFLQEKIWLSEPEIEFLKGRTDKEESMWYGFWDRLLSDMSGRKVDKKLQIIAELVWAMTMWGLTGSFEIKIEEKKLYNDIISSFEKLSLTEKKEIYSSIKKMVEEQSLKCNISIKSNREALSKEQGETLEKVDAVIPQMKKTFGLNDDQIDLLEKAEGSMVLGGLWENILSTMKSLVNKEDKEHYQQLKKGLEEFFGITLSFKEEKEFLGLLQEYHIFSKASLEAKGRREKETPNEGNVEKQERDILQEIKDHCISIGLSEEQCSYVLDHSSDFMKYIREDITQKEGYVYDLTRFVNFEDQLALIHRIENKEKYPNVPIAKGMYYALQALLSIKNEKSQREENLIIGKTCKNNDKLPDVFFVDVVLPELQKQVKQAMQNASNDPERQKTVEAANKELNDRIQVIRCTLKLNFPPISSQ